MMYNAIFNQIYFKYLNYATALAVIFWKNRFNHEVRMVMFKPMLSWDVAYLGLCFCDVFATLYINLLLIEIFNLDPKIS